jgi:hypothetical protein
MSKKLIISSAVIILIILGGAGVYFFPQNSLEQQKPEVKISQITNSARTPEQRKDYCNKLFQSSGFLNLVDNKNTDKAYETDSNFLTDDFEVSCTTIIPRNVGDPAYFNISISTEDYTPEVMDTYKNIFQNLKDNQEDYIERPESESRAQTSIQYIKIVNGKAIFISLEAKDLTVEKTKSVVEKVLSHYQNY